MCARVCVCVPMSACLNRLIGLMNVSLFLRKGKHESDDTVQMSFCRLGEFALKWQFWLDSLFCIGKDLAGRRESGALDSSQGDDVIIPWSFQKPVIIASCLRKEYVGKKKNCFAKKKKKKVATRNVSFCVKKGRKQ